MDAKEKAEREAKIAYVREHGHRMLDEPGDWEVKKAPREEKRNSYYGVAIEQSPPDPEGEG